MNKMIIIFVSILMITSGYLAFSLNSVSAENVQLTKQLVKKEQDYLWLEKELQTTKQQLNSITRKQSDAHRQTRRVDSRANSAFEQRSASLEKSKVGDRKNVRKDRMAIEALIDKSERVAPNGRRL